MAEPRTLLLTRPRAQSEAFAAALEARLPGRFRVGDRAADRDRAAAGRRSTSRASQGLVFTSANGVEQFAARSAERGLPAFCVGEMTAAAARRGRVRGALGRRRRGGAGGAGRRGARGRARGTSCTSAGGMRRATSSARLAAAGVPARAAEIYDQAPVPAAGGGAGAAGGGRVGGAGASSRRGRRGCSPPRRRGAGWDLLGRVDRGLAERGGGRGARPGSAPARAG